MNYELALELSNAGFPPLGHGGGDECQNCFYPTKTGKQQIVCVPTLSELIEACGDRFDNLTKMAPSYKEALWTCNHNDDRANEGRGLRWFSEGNTPEIAVAALWLALNKK